MRRGLCILVWVGVREDVAKELQCDRVELRDRQAPHARHQGRSCVGFSETMHARPCATPTRLRWLTARGREGEEKPLPHRLGPRRAVPAGAREGERARIAAATLAFMRQIRVCYPARRRIYWIQDNLSANWTPDIRTFAAAHKIELTPTARKRSTRDHPLHEGACVPDSRARVAEIGEFHYDLGWAVAGIGKQPIVRVARESLVLSAPRSEPRPP
jgi:hypothetical protein